MSRIKALARTIPITHLADKHQASQKFVYKQAQEALEESLEPSPILGLTSANRAESQSWKPNKSEALEGQLVHEDYVWIFWI